MTHLPFPMKLVKTQGEEPNEIKRKLKILIEFSHWLQFT